MDTSLGRIITISERRRSQLFLGNNKTAANVTLLNKEREGVGCGGVWSRVWCLV